VIGHQGRLGQVAQRRSPALAGAMVERGGAGPVEREQAGPALAEAHVGGGVAPGEKDVARRPHPERGAPAQR